MEDETECTHASSLTPGGWPDRLRLPERSTADDGRPGPWSRITPASTAPSFPDDLVAMVRSPAGGPVRLEDPKVGAGGKVLRELMDDLRAERAAPGWH